MDNKDFKPGVTVTRIPAQMHIDMDNPKPLSQEVMAIDSPCFGCEVIRPDLFICDTCGHFYCADCCERDGHNKPGHAEKVGPLVRRSRFKVIEGGDKGNG